MRGARTEVRRLWAGEAVPCRRQDVVDGGDPQVGKALIPARGGGETENQQVADYFLKLQAPGERLARHGAIRGSNRRLEYPLNRIRRPWAGDRRSEHPKGHPRTFRPSWSVLVDCIYF